MLKKFKYTKQKWHMRGEISKHLTVVGNFYIAFAIDDRIFRPKNNNNKSEKYNH